MASVNFLKMKIKNQSLRVKEGRTELTVEHNKEDLTFIHPYFGPNTYANVQELIEKAELNKPTMAETASLVYSAFNSDDKYSLEIQKLLKEKWLWAFTGILYVPSKGAYIQDIPEIKKGRPYMNESDLVKKLEASDPNVRFVPFGFKTEKMSPQELAKNQFVIALAGEEGAEKLAKVADNFKDQPYLGSFKSVDETITRVSALYSDWDSGRRLDVDGDFHGDGWYGYAFGYTPKKFPQETKATKK